jgi:hypothetical protein
MMVNNSHTSAHNMNKCHGEQRSKFAQLLLLHSRTMNRSDLSVIAEQKHACAHPAASLQITAHAARIESPLPLLLPAEITAT